MQNIFHAYIQLCLVHISIVITKSGDILAPEISLVCIVRQQSALEAVKDSVMSYYFNLSSQSPSSILALIWYTSNKTDPHKCTHKLCVVLHCPGGWGNQVTLAMPVNLSWRICVNVPPESLVITVMTQTQNAKRTVNILHGIYFNHSKPNHTQKE